MQVFLKEHDNVLVWFNSFQVTLKLLNFVKNALFNFVHRSIILTASPLKVGRSARAYLG